MNIQKVSIQEINPAPYNPRVDLKPGDAEYEKLKKNIETFGYIEPLVWNQRTKTLVSGHQRFKILREQGLQEVEVSVIDISLEEEKALNIALNKIEGRWDEDKLASLLDEICHYPDFNVGLTGFDLPDITRLLDNQLEEKEDDFNFEAELESIGQPITQKGDLIVLGDHRLYCCDSSDADSLKCLMGESKANLLHTDPPYNVNYYGGNRPNASCRPNPSKLWDRIYFDNLSQEDYGNWLKGIFQNVSTFLSEGAAIYIWNGHKQFGPMYNMLSELGFHIGCVITWAKPNFAIGFGDYNQQTEFCLYGWKENNGSHHWYGPNNESTLWEISRDSIKDYIHPTQKPIAIASRAMKNSSNQGDIVLDLFLGSGSTLIAAEALKRRCFGLEIDPKYCDAIVRRYIAYRGEKGLSDDLIQRYLVR